MTLPKNVQLQIEIKDLWEAVEKLDFLEPEDLNDIKEELERAYDLDLDYPNGCSEYFNHPANLGDHCEPKAVP